MGGGPWRAVLSAAAGNSALSWDLLHSPTRSEKGRPKETEGVRMLMRVLMV